MVIDSILEMTFDTLLVDLGKINRGEKFDLSYIFENTGNIPFSIDIVTSCNCTETDWERGKTYQPGDKGKIDAIFDSTEKEASETVDVDIILGQNDPKTKYPKILTVQFKFSY